MRLHHPPKERTDTTYSNDRSPPVLPLLFYHLVGYRTGDEECAVEVDGLGFEEERVGHVEEGVEGADAGVGDEDVDA